MIQRQKQGLCIHCGGSSHKSAECSKRRSSSRPPTPRPSSSYSSRQKVNFKRVSGVTSDPQASGWEGDEVDEDEEASFIVDKYLAAESQEIDPYFEENEDEDPETEVE